MVWTGAILVGALLVVAGFVLAIYRRRQRDQRSSAEIDERLKRRLEELQADRNRQDDGHRPA
jgi:hypothetical protein